MIAAFWAFLLTAVVFSVSIFFTAKHLGLLPAKRAKPPLPPAISVLPFLSQLFFRRFSLHEIEKTLRRFHSLHGPILTLRISPLTPPSIFISGSYLSHAALIHHADSFARRPPAVEPIIFLTAGTHDISSSDYGPLWRFLRQNLSAETLHPSRLRSFATGRRWSVQLLLGDIRSHAGQRGIVVRPRFQRAVLSILAFMCFGEKLGDRVISEIDSLQSFLLSLFASFNVFAVLPVVTKLIFHKRWGKIVFARQRQTEIFLPMIKARRERKQNTQDGGGEDYELCYVDSLIDLKLPVEGGRGLTDEEMVNLCHEFLSGAATTATALEWTMAEIVKQHGVQSKILAEIESLIGIDQEGIVKEEDLERMPFLKAVVMESLRRHPPSHFVLPHSVIEEFELNGYLIPNGAEVHFSVANVHWDRWNWDEPMEFRPARFMAGGEGEGVDLTGSKGIKMMPFGAGRRLCPGYKFALLHLELIVANLVREFEWKAEAGEEVDLSENFEFTTVMKNPLRVYAVQRRKIQKKDIAMTRRLKSFDSKGSIKFFYDIMAELKQEGLISLRHQTLLQRTPFHYILHLPQLELNHSLLQELLLQYDNFDNSFTIAGHRLEFKSDDVALIFGLPNHGKPVKLKTVKNKDFYQRVFEKGEVSRFEIVYHLRRQGMDQSDQSVEAFMVLLLGLFISTVLVPSNHASIPSSLWSYVDQLDHICDYDWGHLVYQQLIDEIECAKRHVTGEDADDEPSGSSYGGCFLALQLWICEIAGLGKGKKEDCSPRILGWGRNSMDGILEQFRNLQPSDIRPSMTPLESERHLLDSTILPSDPQPCLPASPTLQPNNLKKSIRPLPSPLQSERHLLDSTILPFDPQPSLPTSPSLQPINFKKSQIRPSPSPLESELHLLDSTILPSNPQPFLPASPTLEANNFKKSIKPSPSPLESERNQLESSILPSDPQPCLPTSPTLEPNNFKKSQIRPSLSPLESEHHLLDSTILPSDPQACLPTSPTLEPNNFKKSIRPSPSPPESERHFVDSIVLPSDPQACLPASPTLQPNNVKKSSMTSKEDEVLQLLRLRDQRISRLKEAAHLLSEDLLVGNNFEPLEYEERGAPSIASDSSSSSEKTMKKVVSWQTSTRLTGSSVRSKHYEVECSDAGGRVSGSKLAASSSLTRTRDRNFEGEETANGREVKKRAERQLMRATTSTRAKQKETAIAQTGNGLGVSNKLSAATSRSFKKTATSPEEDTPKNLASRMKNFKLF